MSDIKCIRCERVADSPLIIYYTFPEGIYCPDCIGEVCHETQQKLADAESFIKTLQFSAKVYEQDYQGHVWRFEAKIEKLEQKLADREKLLVEALEFVQEYEQAQKGWYETAVKVNDVENCYQCKQNRRNAQEGRIGWAYCGKTHGPITEHKYLTLKAFLSSPEIKEILKDAKH